MNVFDSSALLAFAYDESGADLVLAKLEEGGLCGSANWSEVAQKLLEAGEDWRLRKGMFLAFPLVIEPVGAADAEAAAALWRRGSGLSLADRLCLALAERAGGVAWTADTGWRGQPRAELIH